MHIKLIQYWATLSCILSNSHVAVEEVRGLVARDLRRKPGVDVLIEVLFACFGQLVNYLSTAKRTANENILDLSETYFIQNNN